METNKNSIKKTEYSDTFIYNDDASELFTFSSGGVLLQLTLPNAISNGVYALCDGEKYLTDYILFGTNQKAQFIDFPGVYASLSDEGIILTLWTRNGKFVIVDTKTSISSDTSFIVEFYWDSSGLILGSGATMAIFVNDECTASGNFNIYSETISDLDFFSLDSKTVDFNLQCNIDDIVTYSNVPVGKNDSVSSLTHFRFSLDEAVLVGINGSLFFGNGLYKGPTFVEEIKCFADSESCLEICDITGDIYFSSYFGDGYKAGRVMKFDVTRSKISAKSDLFEEPKSIALIQKDGLDYPKSLYYDDSTCDGVWVINKTSLVKLDENMNTVFTISSGFSNPGFVKLGLDGSCWVSDVGYNRIRHYDSDGNLLVNKPISRSGYLEVAINGDVYVHSPYDQKIYVVRGNAVIKALTLSSGFVGFGLNVNTRDIVTAYSDGRVYSFNKAFEPNFSSNIMVNIDRIYVRRGYNQDSFVAIDNTNLRAMVNRVSNPGINILSFDYDSGVYFNGTFSATARNEGVSASIVGGFTADFSVDNITVTDLRHGAYKVDKRNVDLSGGGENSSYFDFNGSGSDRDPTDYQDKTFEAAKI